jgi:hypothetical protein
MKAGNEEEWERGGGGGLKDRWKGGRKEGRMG